jgi:GT2 family glycosyltransferase
MPIQSSIVIVNYNKAAALRRMLQGLALEQSTACEVIVVDNASEDGSAHMLKQEFPQVKRLRRERNRGFAVGANRGINEAQGAVVVICHSDLIASIHTLSELADRVREGQSRRVAAAVPRLVDENRRDEPMIGRFPGLGRALVGVFKPGAARACYVPHMDHVADHEWARLPCVALNADILHSLNNFDERFFLDYADMDLCLRLHERSYRILIANDLPVIHTGRDPNAEPPEHLAAIMREDQQRYFEKHRPKWEQNVLELDAKVYRWVKKQPVEAARVK